MPLALGLMHSVRRFKAVQKRQNREVVRLNASQRKRIASK
ncbi:hypothetical protein BLL52_1873 [Rhodoferax antarcticus ANT.BR]|uniref:Uncharacterized protein n=1 Tax=Rhodoferax antarcticus ANT.BR TaxID=1111071 RepID=A0A1Q8YGJ4_9BURK|nr:hypothetical protein BLL52_1873 [Rhodoferax antarcticus ANT.BR]